MQRAEATWCRRASGKKGDRSNTEVARFSTEGDRSNTEGGGGKNFGAAASSAASHA
jgi:hypothetical protein